MGISVIGSLNYDLDTYTDRIPGPGETIRANDFQTHAGGKGLNQTVAIAKLKQPTADYKVSMVGNVGTDSFGDELVEILEKHNVDVCKIGRRTDCMTGVATILVEQSTGQNRILITAGANGKTLYSPKELNDMFPQTEGDNDKHMVVFQQEIPDPCSIMRWLKKERPHYQIVFNPSPFKAIDPQDWNLVDVLVVNEIESLQILETVLDAINYSAIKKEIENDFIKGYATVCTILQEQCVNKNGPGVVIITLGSEGVLFTSREATSIEFREAVKVSKVIDTTGAGDTFLGAFVTQWYQGSSLVKAIEFSAKASSLTIQTPGAAESIPLFNDVQKNL